MTKFTGVTVILLTTGLGGCEAREPSSIPIRTPEVRESENLSNQLRRDIKITVNILPAMPEPARKLNYQTDIKPFLDENCVFCHTDEEGNQNGIDLSSFPFTSYSVTKLPDQESIVKNNIEWMLGKGQGEIYNQMPPFEAPPSDDVIGRFKTWLEDGLKETPESAAPRKDQTAIDFVRLHWRLFEANESGEVTLTIGDGNAFAGILKNFLYHRTYVMVFEFYDKEGKIMDQVELEAEFDREQEEFILD